MDSPNWAPPELTEVLLSSDAAAATKYIPNWCVLTLFAHERDSHDCLSCERISIKYLARFIFLECEVSAKLEGGCVLDIVYRIDLSVICLSSIYEHGVNECMTVMYQFITAFIAALIPSYYTYVPSGRSFPIRPLTWA